MKLTIKIKLDNAAFDNPCEIGRILNEVTENINNFRNEVIINDINGNKVGSYKMSKKYFNKIA